MNALKHIFEFIEAFFTSCCVVELACRIHCYGPSHFFRDADDYAWNNFDFIITSAGVIDTVLSVTTGAKGSNASIGRLFRLLRILRMFRTLRYLEDVEYVLNTAVQATLKFSFLVLMVVFISGIIAMNMLWDSHNDTVAEMFDSLGDSMWTMFTLMTLDNWVQRVSLVLEEKPGMIFFFTIFIFGASIALMSLVPAIFIELSLDQKTREEKKQQLRIEEANRKRQLVVVEHLFELTDTDDAGLGEERVTSLHVLYRHGRSLRMPRLPYGRRIRDRKWKDAPSSYDHIRMQLHLPSGSLLSGKNKGHLLQLVGALTTHLQMVPALMRKQAPVVSDTDQRAPEWCKQLLGLGKVTIL